jgi:hypothetical protein
MNSAMGPIWAGARVRLAGDRLHPHLCGRPPVEFVGWEDGVFIATELSRGYPDNYLSDLGLTGFEAFVNKIHLDVVVNRRRQGWQARCVAQGMLLAHEVAVRAAPLAKVPLEIAITVDDGEPGFSYPSSTFRFYGRRGDEWLPEHLSEFGQPVARIVTTQLDGGPLAADSLWPAPARAVSSSKNAAR